MVASLLDAFLAEGSNQFEAAAPLAVGAGLLGDPRSPAAAAAGSQ